MAASADPAVPVRRFVLFAPHGLVLPAEAFRLWLDLQARGFTLSDDAGVLVVAPPERLTRQDCIACRRWKPHLMMFLRAAPDGVAAVGPPVPTPDPPACPHCDASLPAEALGDGWWWCPVCARTFRAEVRRRAVLRGEP